MSRWWLWWFCIFGPGSFIKLWGLSAQSLWYDEAFTALVAALPLDRLLAATAGDVHPPLWYLVEKFVVLAVGNNAIALRLPSAAFGILNIWLTLQVGKRLAGDQAGVLASALMAFAPFQLYYSQEARMYEMLQALVLSGAWAVLARRWYLLGLAGAGTVGLYTHNLMAIYLVILWLVGAGRGLAAQGRRAFLEGEDVVGLIQTPVLIALLYSPWAWGSLRQQVSDVANGFWIPQVSLGAVALAFHQLIFSFVLPAWAESHGALLAFILLGLATWRGINSRLWSVLALAFGPVLLSAGVSLAWKPIFLHRTLIGAAPFLYLLIGHLLERLPLRRALVAGGSLGSILLIGLIQYQCFPTEIRPDMAAEAQIIREQWRDGDVLFHMNLSSYILYSYYLPDLPAYLWPQANDLSQSLTDETKSALGIRQSEIWDIPANQPGRIWLIWVDNPHISQAEVAAARVALAWGRNPSLVETIRDDELVTAKVWLLEAKAK